MKATLATVLAMSALRFGHFPDGSERALRIRPSHSRRQPECALCPSCWSALSVLRTAWHLHVSRFPQV